METKKSLYTKWQFAVCRVILGTYLAIKWLNILLTDQRILLQLTVPFEVFQVWAISFKPQLTIVFLAMMVMSSICFLLGIQRRITSACLFTGTIISGQNTLIIELLLLAMALMPSGEALQWRNIKGSPNWKLADSIFAGIWVMIGATYFISGYFAWKYSAIPSSGIDHYATPYMPYIWIITYQIGISVLCIFKSTRQYAWSAIILIDIVLRNVVCFFNAEPLVMYPIIFYMFAIGPDWFMNKKDINQRIVFFDGLCGRYNGWVDFLLDIDHDKRLKFSPLQSDAAKDMLGDHALNMDSIIYYRDSNVYTKSKAVLLILQDMGGIWATTIIFRVIPKIVRNIIYDVIAKNRYNVFGKYDTCRVPTPEESHRFL